MDLKQNFEFKKERYAHIELTNDEKAVAIYQAKKAKLRTDNTEYLSPEEIDEVYRLARGKKQGDLNAIAYMKVVREEKPKELPTASQLYGKLIDWLQANTGHSVNLYDGRDILYMDLCKYFTKDKSGPYDIEKNLWLEGGVGVGKTTVMRFFQLYAIERFAILGARELGYQFLKKDVGVNVIIYHSKNTGGVGLCIDDVGTETALKSFGNEMNVIGEIIVNRYDNRVFPTHVTTNLTTIQFKEMYGERALDRVKEKYNQVLFEGKSLR